MGGKGGDAAPSAIESPNYLAIPRELAVDDALAKMGEGEAPAARAKVRSQAVVEFEIRRDPDLEAAEAVLEAAATEQEAAIA